jgi:sugar/nucleoside kinase (ribokinase family)
MFLQPRLATALPAYLAAVREAGLTTSVDTNWDPREEWGIARDVLEHADVFLPNLAELLAITGLDDVGAAARSIVAGGTVVALKNGADGGMAWSTNGARVISPGLDVEVVDTTGAGDTFDAGFLCGWVEGLGLDECLSRAVIAGSLSTRASGGTAAQPTFDELLQARDGVV